MGPEEETIPKTSSEGGVKDEYLMAAIAHAGILITVIVALVIWLTQKEKSKYVEFQAKQALVYQLVVGVVLIILWIITIILSLVVIGIFLMPVILLLSLAAVGYGLYGAYETYQGKDFRYMIIGDQLSK
jgi:uncharacterized Tic20 family protein